MRLRPLISLGGFGVLALSSALASPASKAPPPVPADIQAVNPMVPTNLIQTPFTPKAGATDYSVNIKFTNHGVKKIPAETISRLVNAVEVIYSQCDGVNFHVNVIGQIQAPYTTDQDNLSSSDAQGNMYLGDRFEKFYSQFPNGPSSGFISVDLVDFMDSQSRKSASDGQPSESFLGQAYAASIMDNLYEDQRSAQYKAQGPLSSAGGNTIRLGMQMLKIVESTSNPPEHVNEMDSKGNAVLDFWGNPIPVIASRGLESSLLAHEMGHILMETQDGKGNYIDHDCPELGVTCPQGYLMSGGGFKDKTYLNVPEMKTPIGYSPLPLVEKAQCNALIHHPLVSILGSAK